VHAFNSSLHYVPSKQFGGGIHEYLDLTEVIFHPKSRQNEFSD
jgi:hypothetical protein